MYQQILILYLFDSALDSEVIGWTFYDGTGEKDSWPGDSDQPPYETGIDALKDQWKLIQMSPVPTRKLGEETRLDHLRHEFVFERMTEKNLHERR